MSYDLKEARKCLNCLAIQLPEEVHKDVVRLLLPVVQELEARDEARRPERIMAELGAPEIGEDEE